MLLDGSGHCWSQPFTQRWREPVGQQVLGTKGRYCLACNFSPESASGPRKVGSDLIETSQELRRRVLCNSVCSYLSILKSACTSTHMSVCTHIMCTHVCVCVYIF